MDLTAKLMSVNSDKKDLLGKLEAAYNRLQYSEEQRSALQVMKSMHVSYPCNCLPVSFKSFIGSFQQTKKNRKTKLPKPGIEPGTFRSSV